MSKLKFTIIFLLIVLVDCHDSYGQYVSAIINDADGYTNVRKDSITTSGIIEKFVDGEVFEYSEDDWDEQKNWIHVRIDRSNNKDKCKYLSTYGTGGYMHKSRLLPMSKMQNNFERKITKTTVELVGKNVQAKIGIRLLSQEEIKVLSEDGCIWGTDMGNPRNVISNVQFESVN